MTGTSSRRRSSSAAATPTQPGRIADEPITPSAWSIGPGSPSPAPMTRERVDAGLGEHLLDELERDVEALVRGVVGVERDGALGEDRRGQVGDRDAQVAVAEVDAERGAGGGVEREQDRRAPALLAVRRAGLLALDDEAVGLQLGDEARDGRAREAGAARDLGAADAGRAGAAR